MATLALLAIDINARQAGPWLGHRGVEHGATAAKFDSIGDVGAPDRPSRPPTRRFLSSTSYLYSAHCDGVGSDLSAKAYSPSGRYRRRTSVASSIFRRRVWRRPAFSRRRSSIRSSAAESTARIFRGPTGQGCLLGNLPSPAPLPGYKIRFDRLFIVRFRHIHSRTAAHNETHRRCPLIQRAISRPMARALRSAQRQPFLHLYPSGDSRQRTKRCLNPAQFSGKQGQDV